MLKIPAVWGISQRLGEEPNGLPGFPAGGGDLPGLVEA